MDLASLRCWFLLLWLCSAPAWAAIKVVGPAVWTGSSLAGHSTAQAACNQRAVLSSRASGTVTYQDSNGAYGALCTVDAAAGLFFPLVTNCPSGQGAYVRWSLQDPNICTVDVAACPQGYAASASGVCMMVCPGFGNTSGSRSDVVNTPGDQSVLCIGQCKVIPTVSAHQSDGTWSHWGPFTALGGACTGFEGGVSAPQPVPAVCGPAECAGTVNGTAVCVPCGETKGPPVTSGTTAPPVDAGSAPAGATPGSTATTEETRCVGGQCTTTRTTVTVGPGGGQTSQTSTSTQPIGTYCAANPGAGVCASEKEESSTWAGSCAGFACGGDAVQCAIAQEQHRRNCALFDTSTTLSQKGMDAASGADPADHPRLNGETVEFSLASMIDSSPLFGTSGSCPSDVTHTVMGQVITLPFASICPYLTIAGAGFMMLCYLVAGLIVFRRD